MISVKKFRALSLKSQVRWLLLGLRELQGSDTEALPNLQNLQNFYCQYIEPVILAHSPLKRQWELCCEDLQKSHNFLELEHLLRQLCALEPSDWSNSEETEGLGDLGHSGHYPLYLYLDRVRSPFNMGSLFRSAAALGVRRLWLHEHCPLLQHPRAQRSAMGAIDMLQALRCNDPQQVEELRSLPWLGLETPDIVSRYGGCSLGDTAFPAQGGLLLVGAEDSGLRPELLEYCSSAENRQRGGTLLSIPMLGAKSSLNLGVAGAIALQRWSELF